MSGTTTLVTEGIATRLRRFTSRRASWIPVFAALGILILSLVVWLWASEDEIRLWRESRLDEQYGLPIFTTGPIMTSCHSGRMAATASISSASSRSSITP